MKIKQNAFLILLLCFSLFFSTCNFFNSVMDTNEQDASISFDKTKLNISIGNMDIITVSISTDQNSATVTWEYDSSIIMAKTDNYAAVITGISPGTTTLVASCGQNTARCVITVSDDNYIVNIANPYVYASNDYLDVIPGQTVKVSAALFGGTSADINGFTWSIDKPSVASLVTEGNYCWITGITDGFAKVSVRHAKSTNSYSVLVNCSSDGTVTPYITTTQNIVTINTSETDRADIEVDLINPPLNYENGFEFSITDEEGNTLTNAPVVIESSTGAYCSLRSINEGDCYIKVHHTFALYDFMILVRVVKNVETAFIEPTTTMLTLVGNNPDNISLTIKNYEPQIISKDFTWHFPDNFTEYVDYELCNGNGINTGDYIFLRGKKTGSVKITVTYPGLSDRTIVVLIRDIAIEAASATTYISTSQNYIRLKKDTEPFRVNISLEGAAPGDISQLKWKIVNMADDDSTNTVIKWTGGDGTSSESFERSANLGYSESAYCIIEPVAIGTAYIEISHPKAIYTTRIDVVVTDAEPEIPPVAYLSASGNPVIKIKNGETTPVDVMLSGCGSEDSILWEIQAGGKSSVVPNGASAVVSAPSVGSGISKSELKISHPNAQYPITYTIITYDTIAELAAVQTASMWTSQNHINVDIGQSFTLRLNIDGFKETPNITWTCSTGNNSIISVENTSIITEFNIIGLKKGSAIVTASCAECEDVVFLITVQNQSIINETEDCYLSTHDNVIFLEDVNSEKTITVALNNILSSESKNIVWSISDTTAFEIFPNGNSATIRALKTNQAAIIKITHPLCVNTLVINVKSGEQFEYINDDFCYISTETDNLNLYAGQDEVIFHALLSHTIQPTDTSASSGFSFSIKNPDIATVSSSLVSNFCYIKPIRNGITTLTISHPDADLEKEIVIVVNKTPNSSDFPYLSTNQNVITVLQGDYITANVNLSNSLNIAASSYTWTSRDESIAKVIVNNGGTAMINAEKAGTTTIEVKHSDCLYKLELVIVVLDSALTTTRPYIMTSSQILTLQKGKSTTITAQMLGGIAESDSAYFTWSTNNSPVTLINGVGESCYIKALSKGQATITVKNSRYIDSYSKSILVIVEDTQEEGVYIKPSQNILKIRPENKELNVITASLIGGNETDVKDFIWWADDPGLIGLTTVANQCSVIPTGRSGTTKIHIKHAKAEQEGEILVMVSSYDVFAFSSNSAVIMPDQLYFFPLCVPAVDGTYTVEYESESPEICIIEGSNAVAWVCGKRNGTTNLRARLKLADGTIIATAEMYVSVNIPEPNPTKISFGQAVLTMESGSSQTISALLEGVGIESTDKYKLRWRFKNTIPDGNISFLDAQDGISYGAECYVTVGNSAGQYVIACEYEKDGVIVASADMYIVVEEKGEVIIELKDSLIECDIDDGSFDVTANLINGTQSDYAAIEWSAVKVGGANIISVSKSKGKSCAITPREIGQTMVIARLPNGKTARCVIIVKASAEVKLGVGTIHVIPGYTEVVPYTITPENATVQWLPQYTSAPGEMLDTQYFTVIDDTAKKQLLITGKQDLYGQAAGTVTGIMSGANTSKMPKLTVYVEYSIELLLQQSGLNASLTQIYNDAPRTANTKTFDIIYYPTDLDITISIGDPSIVSLGTTVDSTVSIEGITKGRKTVTLVPTKEGSCNINVKGILKSNPDYKKESSFIYNAFYSEYEIEAHFQSLAGTFSKYETTGASPIFILGDGEESTFYLSIKNENAAGEILGVTWTPVADSQIEFSLNNAAYQLYKEDRLTWKQEIFGKIHANSLDPHQKGAGVNPYIGLIYLAEAEGAGSETEKYYTIAHCWDYYKELPVERDRFALTYFDQDVDYYLVSKELVGQRGGLTYYTVDHNSIDPSQLLTPTWRKWTYERNWSNHGTRYSNYTDGIALSANNNFVNIYYYQVPEDCQNGQRINLDCQNFNQLQYIDCYPYIMTKEELQANHFFSVPYVWFYANSGEDYYNDYKNRYESCTQLRETRYRRFRNTCQREKDQTVKFFINKWITPTISKNTDVFFDKKIGTVGISYKTAKGTVGTYTLPVKLQKRNCEAYTNGHWEEEDVRGKRRWVINSRIFPDSVNIKASPFFALKQQSINASPKEISVSPDILNVTYETNPIDSILTVSVPLANNGKRSLTLKKYDSYNGSGTYTIRNHSSITNEIASGILEFIADDQYVGTVTISASGTNLAVTNTIQFDITNVSTNLSIERKVPYLLADSYSQNSLSSRYSSYDQENMLLTLGDGESIQGRLEIPDDAIITWNPFSKRGAADWSGKYQSDFVNFEITRTNDSFASFSLSHSFDYGAFEYNGGSVNQLYTSDSYATFLSSNIYSEIQANPSDYANYGGAPTPNYGEPEGSDSYTQKYTAYINQCITDTKERKQPVARYNWGNQHDSACTEDTISLEIEPGEYEEITNNVTFVGEIKISFKDIVTGENITNTILIGVAIHQTPCTVDEKYGQAPSQPDFSTNGWRKWLLNY